MTDSIRILHLVASSRGGGATHVRDLARGLDPTRFAVHVAMPEDGGQVQRKHFAAADIPFHPMAIAEGISPRAVWHLRRLMRGVDILHVHGARAAFFGRLAAASACARRPRVIYSVHGFAAPHYPHPRRAMLLVIERALASLTDRVIAVSHAERQALLTAGITRPERIHVVWYGIDVARFQNVMPERSAQRASLGVPVDACVIVMMCRLYKPRDFPTLLSAFGEVVNACPAAWLLLVGDGPYRSQVEALIKKLNLSARITLAGLRRDIPQILSVSDMLVLSTAQWEGLPLTILEAMAAGLPVVASDVGGIREAIVHMETGSVVPQKDPRALAEALRQLLTDPARARTMGHRGRERAERYFRLERMVRNTAAIYEDVLNENETRRLSQARRLEE